MCVRGKEEFGWRGRPILLREAVASAALVRPLKLALWTIALQQQLQHLCAWDYALDVSRCSAGVIVQ